MLTGNELDTFVDWWQAQATGVSPELTAYQDQVLHALAQGTPWAGGRLPLSFQSSPYRVRVNESRFFAGSALDCLQLPFLLGGAVTVESTCPSNGQAIRLVIASQGVTCCDPPGCVLSLVMPGLMSRGAAEGLDDPGNMIRQLSHFFSTAEAAALWLVAYPEAAVLDIDQAWRLANHMVAGLGRTAPTAPGRTVK